MEAGGGKTLVDIAEGQGPNVQCRSPKDPILKKGKGGEVGERWKRQGNQRKETDT